MIALDVVLRFPGFELSAQLELGDGVTGIFGPSGAGKSTLLEILAGLRAPDEGSVSIGGTKVFDRAAGIDVAPERRNIGYVFQEARLFPHLSVRSNLLYGWRLRQPHQRSITPERIVELLELEQLLDRPVQGLSGGEAQRLALGRALLCSPRLLLLDEPVSALDAGLRRSVLGFLARIRDELAVPILYVSHALSEIQELTSRVVVMDRGEVLAHGDVFEALRDERCFELATRLGLESVLEVKVRAHEKDVTAVTLAAHDLVVPKSDLQAGEQAYIAVRPQDVMVAREVPQGLSARNALRGTITQLVELGDRWLLTADVGQLIRAEITSGSVDALGLERGTEVVLLVKTYSFRWV